MRFLWFMTLFSLCGSGCIRTAVVQFWEPAAIDVGQMKNVVVMDFSGEHGSAVATALAGQLRQNEFYTVADRHELTHELQLAGYVRGASSSESLHVMLMQAKAREIDGVLIGEVVDYRCEDRQVRKLQLTGTGNSGKVASTENTLRETLVRDATVSVSFRLIDVETGEVRASKVVMHHFNADNEQIGAKLPSQTEVLESLTEKCVEDIVGMLAPHQASTEIQLAICDIWTRGRRDVKEGNQQAEIGNWEAAVEQWRKALEIEPKNHAALFNLAIAADHQRDYARAEELAMEALRLQHKTCYTAGLDKIRSHRAAAEKTDEQRDARVATYAEGLW